MFALMIQHHWLALFLLLAVSAMSACSKAQPPNDKFDGLCKLRIEQSPELRGLRLGMTVEEVKRRFPALEIPPADEIGGTGLEMGRYSPDWRGDRGLNFEGLNGIGFSFLDGRLSRLSLRYERKPERISQEEFSSLLSKTFDLPFFIDRLECYDFRVVADARLVGHGYGPELYLEDVAAQRTYMERLKPVAERREAEARRAQYEKERRESEVRKEAYKP